MVRVSFLKEDKEVKNGNGKPKDVSFIPPTKPKEIIQPAESMGFMYNSEERKYILDKSDIQNAIIACQSHITRYSEKKRINSPQNQLIWDHIVELKEKLQKMLKREVD